LIPPMWARRLLRPLIPHSVMARFRLHQHSRQVRTNVDVVLENRRMARRWLATTPDTYRVRLPQSFTERVPSEDELVLVSSRELDAGQRARLFLSLSDGFLDAAILGEVPTPRLVRHQRAEPSVAPLAITVRRESFEEVGGAPDGEHPLPGLLDRLRTAGHRLALLPQPPAGAPEHRTDPIARDSVVILSAVPLHDVGGGSRGGQMSLEMVRHGLHVTHVALYGTHESVDLGLRFIHPHLEQRRADQFDPERHARRLTNTNRLLIIELPHPLLEEPARRLKQAGFRVIYDLIDDWSAPSLGGEWYQPEAEQAVVDFADALVASAPDLADRLARYGRPVTLVPNGVDAEIFGRQAEDLPEDFPPGEGPVFGYHGSLYGDWFDWRGLNQVAQRWPEARVVVIGDPRGVPQSLSANIHFLGLKPQAALPDYLGRLDVGLLPWLVSELTHAVSPLKIYEYLAMGVPVAAPPLRSLHRLEGVHTSASLVQAVEEALRGTTPDRAEALRAHSWSARLAGLFQAAGLELPPVSAEGARVRLRPPTHWRRGERLLPD
jgi:glycosyltransferase involved in cell wall biosynthesis